MCYNRILIVLSKKRTVKITCQQNYQVLRVTLIIEIVQSRPTCRSIIQTCLKCPRTIACWDRCQVCIVKTFQLVYGRKNSRKKSRAGCIMTSNKFKRILKDPARAQFVTCPLGSFVLSLVVWHSIMIIIVAFYV